MKRSTCKVLIGIAVLWLIIIILFNLATIPSPSVVLGDTPPQSAFILGIFIFGIPAWILLIITIVKWNSEKEYKRPKEHKIKSEHKVEIKKK